MKKRNKDKISFLKNSIYLLVAFSVVLVFCISFISNAEEPVAAVADETASNTPASSDQPAIVPPVANDPGQGQNPALTTQVGDQPTDQAPTDGASQNANNADMTTAPEPGTGPVEDVSEAEQTTTNDATSASDGSATLVDGQDPAPSAQNPALTTQVGDQPTDQAPTDGASQNANNANTSSAQEQTTPDVVIQQPAQVQQPDIVLTVPKSPALQPEITVPKKYFSFGLAGQPIATSNDLLWLPAKYQTETDKGNTEINVGISNDVHQKLIFSGACSKTFFVVLAFQDPKDYIDDPGKYIYNKAFSCKNGGYYYELDDLSTNLSDGVYYFMVAEEGLTGPWQPITAIQPVRIISAYK